MRSNHITGRHIGEANKRGRKDAEALRAAAINAALLARDKAIATYAAARPVALGFRDAAKDTAQGSAQQVKRAFAYVGGFVRTFVGNSSTRPVPRTRRSAGRDSNTAWRESASPNA